MAEDQDTHSKALSESELDPETHLVPSSTRQEEDIEEGRAAYQPGRFHPVYIGDVFNSRYKVLNKIGYGRYSTVWLVRDLENKDGPENEFRALKVLSAECYGQGHDTFEKEILTHLRNGDQSQLGYAYVCHLLDHFHHEGPNGTHMCLIFELMGEALSTFGIWFQNENMLPYSIMRRFTIQLALALDFAHEHNVVHTDIKSDNIFIKFRRHPMIESGYLVEVPIPEQNRAEKKYYVIVSTPLRAFYFNEEDGRDVQGFDIALGDWGVSSWRNKHLTKLIQPVALRAPEVLIDAPWDITADWWNLGAVIYEVFRATQMFTGMVPPDWHYELKQHLAEIVDFFGPFPKELLEKGNQDIVQENFDAEGRVKDSLPIDRPALASELFMPGLSQEERDEFASFLQGMMKINPTERFTATDALCHPWLHAMKKKDP